MRLDRLLYESGLVKSRTKAAELISKGLVMVGGNTVTKPSFEADCVDNIEITDDTQDSYVGRGGLKLEGALSYFNINVQGAICADIGASTGGFTDCLLKNGASHVFAIDAGHGQLAESLKNDIRVTDIEGCNARYIDENTLGQKCDVAVCDLSFISQTLVIPAIKNILVPKAVFITLIKPQFECGREALGKNGIVRDKKQHIEAMRRVAASLRENGFAVTGVMRSPITGGDGNREFLFCSVFGGDRDTVTDGMIKEAAYG